MTINLHEPIFVVGAPKTGSTALHVAFSNSKLFNYPNLKDTKQLGLDNFSLDQYEKYYMNNKRRVFEADQNLAIYPKAFKEYYKEFHLAQHCIRVTRTRREVLLSFLVAQENGICSSIEEAIESHWNWMVEHGL